MDHVAIMKKSWGLLPQILSGHKTIETRSYENRCAPWEKIKIGETVFFKNSGEPVTVQAEVEKIMQFENLTPSKIKTILKEYGRADGIEKEKIGEFFKLFKNKKYCLLIFLKNPTPVKPFDINKSGFGSMSAWLTTPNISKIKK
jgi:ASC-1-like (ASCH) protein